MTSTAPSRPVEAPAAAPQPRGGLDLLLLVAILAVLATFVRALWFTPLDALQGPAQKIFYVHVPSAFTALYIAFPILAIASAVYLWLRDVRADRVAESAAEVGLVFMTVVLVSGPIWGKPIWGTWWTWDARLTLTLFLFLLFLGYLTLRAAVREPVERARFSAVLGIMALVLVPFIHLSVYLFRTLHPQPILLKPSRPSLPPEMLRTLLTSMGVYTVLYLGYVTLRYGIGLRRAAQLREADDA